MYRFIFLLFCCAFLFSPNILGKEVVAEASTYDQEPNAEWTSATKIEFQVTSLSFPDVSETHWAFYGIEWAKKKEFIMGYPNGTFQPSATLTEAETAAIFARYFHIHPGGVLSNQHWAQAYYDTLYSLNIPFKGFANDKIKDQSIPRGVFAQVIHKSQGGNGALQDAVQFMIDTGLTTAKSYNDYKVNGSLTRAEAATFFHRMNEKGFIELKR